MVDLHDAGWVLHVCPPNGGGVDRFVRDICSRRSHDWIAHVSNTQCVLEQPSVGNVVALGWEQLQQAIHAGVVGLPTAVHAHSTEPAIRRVCSMWGTAMTRVVTLHDVGFVGEGEEALNREQRHQFLREAQALTAPSEFIAGLLHTTPGLEDLDCHLVENGADEPAGQVVSFALDPKKVCPVAVVGAIGPHKGWSSLEAVVAALPDDSPVVLLGYAEQRLTQGWLIPGKLWVHGAFQLEELPSLVRSYGVKLAFFPPGQPESYCYALSDIWLAGVSVLAPNLGALGERVHKHTGGELYDSSAPPEKLAARLLAMVAGETDDSRVALAKRSIPSVDTMANALQRIYLQHGVADGSQQPQLQALQANAARHLDSAFFRRELINLDGQTAQLARERDAALLELRQLARTQDERVRWQEHLEQDIETLTQQINTLRERHIQAEEQLVAMREALNQVQATSVRMIGRIEQLLCWLPNGLTRRILHKLTK
jgi:hypothetical protein